LIAVVDRATDVEGTEIRADLGRLLGLLGNRDRRLQQTGDRRQSLVGGLKRLLGLSNIVEQCAQFVGAIGKRLGGEI
jgi:hypothetical protein